jgi:hypothetical protein
VSEPPLRYTSPKSDWLLTLMREAAAEPRFEKWRFWNWDLTLLLANFCEGTRQRPFGISSSNGMRTGETAGKMDSQAMQRECRSQASCGLVASVIRTHLLTTGGIKAHLSSGGVSASAVGCQRTSLSRQQLRPNASVLSDYFRKTRCISVRTLVPYGGPVNGTFDGNPFIL